MRRLSAFLPLSGIINVRSASFFHPSYFFATHGGGGGGWCNVHVPSAALYSLFFATQRG